MPATNIVPFRKSWQLAHHRANDQKKRTVRFPLHAPVPAAARLAPPGTWQRADAARATALNYRRMADAEGRPVTQALLVRLAQKWEHRAAELEATHRGPQQRQPGDLFACRHQP